MDARADHRMSARTRRRQWLLVALLIAAGVVNYLDRSTLAIANHAVATDMHMSTGQMGLLLSAFAWAYALAQLPAGALTDRVGPHITLSVAMGAWSLAQIACGTVQNFGQFILARVALGLGESPMFTAGARAAVSWYPVRERGFPLGLFNSASSLGPALAPPILTWLMLGYGWRWMFVLMGVLGLVVSGLWWLYYREPEEAGVPPEDIAAIHAEDVSAESQAGPALWLEFFKIPTTWAMMGGQFGTVYVIWLCVSWLPYYLETARHTSALETGYYAAIPQFAGVAGGVLGGLLTDRLARRGLEPVWARKLPSIVCLVAAGVLTALAPLPAGTGASLALFSAAMFFAYASSSCSWALGATLTPPHLVATVEAMQNVGGSFGGALAPAVAGFIVEYAHGFGPAFLVGAVAALASAVSFALVKGDAFAGIGEAATAKRRA